MLKLLQMKKIFNFRLFLLLAICLLVASFFATYIFVAEKLKLVMFLIFVSLFVVSLILLVSFKRKFLGVISILLLFVALPFISNYAKSKSLSENVKYEDSAVFLTGKISGNYKFTTSGNLEILLDDVSFDYDNQEVKLNGKVVIYTKPENLDLSKLDAGVVLKVKTKLSAFTLARDNLSRSLSYLNRGIVASGFSMFYNITVTNESRASVKDKICLAVFNKLENADVKYSEIGYAMMFGDSNVLTDEVKNSFRATGIAHLLAVSGLHVSLIVLMLSFVLRKLKVNYKLNFALSIVFLSFYCYLCDFSVSVLRASLMALFSLYASMRGKCYDNLSVLSIAAIIPVLISPIEMLNISFVLSFTAVLSIILLSKPLVRILNKVFYEKFSNVLALNIAVQIGLFAANVFYFGRFSLLGIFANLIAVPIASTAFIVLVATTCLAFVFPFMDFLIKAFGLLMSVVVKFNGWISTFDVTLRFGMVSPYAMLVMFVFMFMISDYVFAGKKKKCLFAASSIGLTLFLLLI